MKIEDIQQATVLSIDAIDEAIGYLNGLVETEPNQNAEQLNILERLYFAQVHLTNARQGLPLNFMQQRRQEDESNKDLNRVHSLLKIAVALLDAMHDASPYSQSADQLRVSGIQEDIKQAADDLALFAPRMPW